FGSYKPPLMWCSGGGGAGSIGRAGAAARSVGMDYYAAGAEPTPYFLWTWMEVGGFAPSIRLYLDGLSLVMTGVITGVGFLIHLYATGYMWDEEGYSRFFAYMNLFVFAMLMLVLGDNLLVLFLGWEGVGLCSYLLIGFFHKDPENGYAARKAFVVTRVGDTAMLLGLFLLFREVGSIEVQAAMAGARELWPDGSTTVTIIALLLLGGAVGKSAQVPLQTWLPDAMAGPTPVSALIHAATMVTAGVYLIARTHDLFLLSPTAQFAVAAVGLVTLFISSFTALTQRDIKRVLAYSTMSQIGYMFLALGVGAWSAAIFHLMTHAFFKALLFLASGSVILALHHEQDMFRMGGLWKKLPIPFASMLIGSVALAALPFTSGFYSKDAIVLASFEYGSFFWAGAAIAAFMTALYTTRMMVITFFGETKTEPHDHSHINMWGPLLVLAALAVGGGWYGLEAVASVLPDGGVGEQDHFTTVAILTMAAPILGIVIGYLIFHGRQLKVDRLVKSQAGDATRRFWFGGWGFDTLYDRVFVGPFVWFARINKRDGVDFVYTAAAGITRGFHHVVALTQSGHLRWYAANMAIGLLVAFAIVLVVLA
ncbi:MAG: NADH-quinone oxidoreductase subunit L, partial [Gammaproteobacteria bacterium]|nr:NADH-quinone oxidoreductase subunit L [Gammaproteobacteria bacterium]